MADGAPDLIQRAAARFERVRPGTTSIVPPRVHEIPAAPTSQPTRASGVTGNSDLTSAGTVISPAKLAAHGISLPGVGFSRTVEEFRAIKRHVMANAVRLRNSPGRDAGRVVLITSAKPGDGKTFNAINLALALAYEKDASVLLLDADAYRQSLLETLGISADKGWIDVISGGSVTPRDVILNTNIVGLQVLPAGKHRPEIPELMSSRTMKLFVEELIRENPDRYVIMDSLPCLTSIEPSILAALAGQTVFVVAAHQTSRDEIESSLRLLNASPSVNLVLNRAVPSLGEQFRDYDYA